MCASYSFFISLYFGCGFPQCHFFYTSRQKKWRRYWLHTIFRGRKERVVSSISNRDAFLELLNGDFFFAPKEIRIVSEISAHSVPFRNITREHWKAFEQWCSPSIEIFCECIKTPDFFCRCFLTLKGTSFTT